MNDFSFVGVAETTQLSHTEFPFIEVRYQAPCLNLMYRDQRRRLYLVHLEHFSDKQLADMLRAIPGTRLYQGPDCTLYVMSKTGFKPWATLVGPRHFELKDTANAGQLATA